MTALYRAAGAAEAFRGGCSFALLLGVFTAPVVCQEVPELHDSRAACCLTGKGAG